MSPLLITLELLPIILDSASSCGNARIVLVSSRAHEQGVWNPAQFNPETEEQFSRLRGYPHTKMQNVRDCSRSLCLLTVYVSVSVCLFLSLSLSLPPSLPFSLLQVMTSFALQRRLQNVSITVSSAEPGYVSITIRGGSRGREQGASSPPPFSCELPVQHH